MKAEHSRLMLQLDHYGSVTTEVNLMQGMGNTYYHSKCYRKFTAVKRPSADSQYEKDLKKKETRSRSSLTPSDTRDLLKGYRIFCSIQRKTIKNKVEPLSQCLTKNGCDATIEAAPRSRNERLKVLVASGVNLITKEAQYHKSCHRKFFKEVGSVSKTEGCQVDVYIQLCLEL